MKYEPRHFFYTAVARGFLILVLILLFALFVTGCATTVSTSRVTTAGEKCASKVSGLFLAHGFSIPDSCREEAPLQ